MQQQQKLWNMLICRKKNHKEGLIRSGIPNRQRNDLQHGREEKGKWLIVLGHAKLNVHDFSED